MVSVGCVTPVTRLVFAGLALSGSAAAGLASPGAAPGQTSIVSGWSSATALQETKQSSDNATNGTLERIIAARSFDWGKRIYNQTDRVLVVEPRANGDGGWRDSPSPSAPDLTNERSPTRQIHLGQPTAAAGKQIIALSVPRSPALSVRGVMPYHPQRRKILSVS